MQVTFTNAAAKVLRRKMPKKDAVAIVNKLLAYAETGTGDVKKLQGRDGYRLRHGQWRAIFEIENDIIVLTIAHRREAY